MHYYAYGEEGQAEAEPTGQGVGWGVGKHSLLVVISPPRREPQLERVVAQSARLEHRGGCRRGSHDAACHVMACGGREWWSGVEGGREDDRWWIAIPKNDQLYIWYDLAFLSHRRLMACHGLKRNFTVWIY